MSRTTDFCLYVNGERVPEALVLDEAKRLRGLAEFGETEDSATREAQIIFAAERGAVERVLVKQEAAKDETRIGMAEMEREYAALLASGGCRPGADPKTLVHRLENQVRFGRVIRKLMGEAPAPREETRALTTPRMGMSLTFRKRLRPRIS